jgi:hypothetical protein
MSAHGGAAASSVARVLRGSRMSPAYSALTRSRTLRAYGRLDERAHVDDPQASTP